ncbi:probable E3 SUMO-protein ligase RNF212 [Liolophura sinensis]|uniref:probable E3 SUMO-protein ligase RNF212 n=1 Tax=Liolophura sinensis TaxID=3198878 RepID=UPI003158D612
MADWVHCNLCFHQPGDGRKFFLTNCGHIYCELCLKEGTENKCKMCGSACSTIALSAKMKPDVEIFFTDPADILQKHRKQLLQVMEFQKNHRRRLNAYIRDKVSKQREMIEISQKNVNHFQEMERYITKLREENLYLKKLITDKGISGTQRPGTQGNRLNSSPGGYRASPGSHSQTSSPYRGTSSAPASSQRRDRHHSGDVPKNPLLRSLTVQQILPFTSPVGGGRISLRTPPINGKLGPASTPKQLGQVKSIRASTPGAGEALRHNFATPQQSPKFMTIGTPQTIQVSASCASSMNQYRHPVSIANSRASSPGFTVHTPRGADTLFL